MIKNSSIINKNKKNNLIQLLILFFMFFSFFDIVSSESRNKYELNNNSFKTSSALKSVAEKKEENSIDVDDFLIDYLTKIILTQSIKDLHDSFKELKKQLDDDKAIQLDADCEMILKLIDSFNSDDKNKVFLEKELFLYLIDFSLKLLKNLKDYEKNIKSIETIFNKIDIQNYYQNDDFFQNKIEEKLQYRFLSDQKGLIDFFNDQYIIYLKNFIKKEKEKKIEHKEFMKVILSSENNIQCYCKAIMQLFQESQSDNLTDHIVSIAPFLLYYCIEHSTMNIEEFFKDIWGSLKENKKCSEKKLIENKVEVESQDIVNIIFNYITKIKPNAKELMNLLYFLEDFIKNNNHWCIIYSTIIVKYQNQIDQKILEFFKHIDFDDYKKVFVMPIFDILDENEDVNQYIEEFNSQYNEAYGVKYRAIEDIKKNINIYKQQCSKITDCFAEQEKSLEEDYQNWKNKLCRDKNKELANFNKKKSSWIKAGKFFMRLGSSILQDSQQKLKDDLKEKMINEICDPDAFNEYDQVLSLEPTEVYNITEKSEEFIILQDDRFECLQNEYIEKIEAKKTSFLKQKREKSEESNVLNNKEDLKKILSDFNTDLERTFKKEKYKIIQEGNKAINEKKKQCDEKKEKRITEIETQYTEKKSKIEENQEILEKKKKLENDLDTDFLFKVNNNFEILKNMIKPNFLPKDHLDVSKELYIALYHIIEFNQNQRERKKIDVLRCLIESVFNLKSSKLNEGNLDDIYRVLVDWHSEIFNILYFPLHAIKEIIKISFDDKSNQKINSIENIECLFGISWKNQSIISILGEILNEPEDENKFLDLFAQCKKLLHVIHKNKNHLDIYVSLFKLLDKVVRSDNKRKQSLYNCYAQLIIEYKKSLINKSWPDVFLEIENAMGKKNKILLNMNILNFIFNLLQTNDEKEKFLNDILSQKKEIVDSCRMNKDNSQIKIFKKQYKEGLYKFSENIEGNLKHSIKEKINSIFKEEKVESINNNNTEVQLNTSSDEEDFYYIFNPKNNEENNKEWSFSHLKSALKKEKHNEKPSSVVLENEPPLPIETVIKEENQNCGRNEAADAENNQEQLEEENNQEQLEEENKLATVEEVITVESIIVDENNLLIIESSSESGKSAVVYNSLEETEREQEVNRDQEKPQEVEKEDSSLIKYIEGYFDTLKNIINNRDNFDRFVYTESMYLALSSMLFWFDLKEPQEKIVLLQNIYNSHFVEDERNKLSLDNRDEEEKSLFVGINEEMDLLFESFPNLDDQNRLRKDFFSVILYKLLINYCDRKSDKITTIIQFICTHYQPDDNLLLIIREVVKKINNSNHVNKNKLQYDFYLLFKKNYKAVYGEKIFQVGNIGYAFLFTVLNVIRDEGLLLDSDYFFCYAQLIVSIKKDNISWDEVLNDVEKKTNRESKIIDDSNIIKNILAVLNLEEYFNDFVCFNQYIKKNNGNNLERDLLNAEINKIKQLKEPEENLSPESNPQKEAAYDVAIVNSLLAVQEEQQQLQKALRSYRGPLCLITIASIVSIINNHKIIGDLLPVGVKGKKLIESLSSLVSKDNSVLNFFDAHKRAINYASIGIFTAGLIYAFKIKKDNNKIKERLLNK